MKYYSTQETADKLGLTRQRITQLIKENKIVYELVGKTHIISEESIKFFKQNKEKK